MVSLERLGGPKCKDWQEGQDKGVDQREDILCERNCLLEDEAEIAYLMDGCSTVSTARGEELVVVLCAVGLAFPLKERGRAHFLSTVGTEEMLRVPCLPQRCNYLETRNTFSTRIV